MFSSIKVLLHIASFRPFSVSTGYHLGPCNALHGRTKTGEQQRFFRALSPPKDMFGNRTIALCTSTIFIQSILFATSTICPQAPRQKARQKKERGQTHSVPRNPIYYILYPYTKEDSVLSFFFFFFPVVQRRFMMKGKNTAS